MEEATMTPKIAERATPKIILEQINIFIKLPITAMTIMPRKFTTIMMIPANIPAKVSPKLSGLNTMLIINEAVEIITKIDGTTVDINPLEIMTKKKKTNRAKIVET